VFEQRPPRPTDGFSVAALVAGIVGTGPVAFVLGAIGLHRTGRGAAAGRGFAVAGIVLGGLQMLFASLTVAWFVGVLVTGASLSSWLPVSPFGATGATDIDGLHPGDCFDDGEDAGASGTVDRTDCSTVHDGEVLEVVHLPEGAYPGASELELYAEDRCADDAADAVDAAGLDPEDFEYGYYYPLAENWADGSRLLQCTIHGWEADLQGSVLDGDATLSP
jgi:hypothetical protein